MSWLKFVTLDNWKELLNASELEPQLIFKHSTRCSISSMVLGRFESSDLFQTNALGLWFLDLIAFRDLSNLIALETNISHESPQCIVIVKQKVIYAESHGAINTKVIQDLIQNL